ncbi:MAG: tRNA lysidine(34) synthetase TilS [Chloroflexi bacterium]|nr:tRNA lysidine(34) synthetase TilS [Chloroflexota bacterium]
MTTATHALPLIRDAVRKALEAHGLCHRPQPLVAAVSGGQDSVALLLALAELRQPLGIAVHVAHLDHGLRPREAEKEAQFVGELASSLGMPFTVGHEDVPALAGSRRLSLEDAGRRLRYAFLTRTAHDLGGDTVALGHTLDDQVETVLLHLVRGAGMRGLRAMQPMAPWRDPQHGLEVRLFRPLLEVSRDRTRAACREAGVAPREDPSNLSLRFSRNRIRHEIVPKLRELNPAVLQAMARLARSVAQDEDYLEQAAAQHPEAMVQRSPGAMHLDRDVLLRLHPSVRHRLLQMAYEELHGQEDTLEQVHVDAMAALLDGSPGRKLTLPGGVVFSTSYTECILGPDPEEVCPLPPLPAETVLVSPGMTEVNGWRVLVRVLPQDEAQQGSEELARATLDADAVGLELLARPRRRGDRFHPLGLSLPKRLQDFFVDAKVPRAWRDRVPLVVSPQGIAWVVGYRIAHWARVTPDTRRVVELSFRRSEPSW